MENIHERSGRAGGDMGKVLAAILDFLMVFFGAGYAIGLLTGNVTAEGFKLEGAPALLLFALIILYFVAGSKYLGGTVWQRILYKT